MSRTDRDPHVGLNARQFAVEEPDEAFYRKYMGGSALATNYLPKDMPGGVDPLALENVLVFAPSVLTGTAVSGQRRRTAAAKSLLTGAATLAGKPETDPNHRLQGGGYLMRDLPLINKGQIDGYLQVTDQEAMEPRVTCTSLLGHSTF